MRWKFVTWLTVVSTKMAGILLRKRKQIFTFEAFGKMPKNSLGWVYYHTLNKANLKFHPNLIRHDLKHILLGYSMEMPDELKINTFLIGNKSYNPLAIIHLICCLLIVPEIIPGLKNDYRSGKNTPPLRNVDLNQWVKKDLEYCREKLGIYHHKS